MNGREFDKLARRHLLPHLPGFRLKRSVIYAVPVHRLWRRFDLYPSGFSRERFTLECAVSPLYVPDSHSAYPACLSDRLPKMGGLGDRWWTWQPGDEGSEATLMADLRDMMLSVGVPHLTKLDSPAAVAERLLDCSQHANDPHVAESLAYSLILSGCYPLAREKLDLLRSVTLDDQERARWWAELHPAGRTPPREDWVLTVGKRGAAVARALDQSPDAAIRLLDEWNAEQLATLRLPAASRSKS